jgi:tripeptidyl-peptidase-2
MELPKGEYVLKAQLLNESMKVLESLKNITLMVDQKLSKPDAATLKLYDNHVDLHSGAAQAKFNGMKLHPGERIVLTLDLNLEGDAVPKEAQPGDILVGSFGFASEGKGQIRYIVPPSVKKEDEVGNETADVGKNENEIPELLTATSKKIKDKEEKVKFLDKLTEEYPKFLGALVTKLEVLDADDKDAANRKEVVATADKMLSMVDETQVKLWIGTQKPPVVEQSEAEKKENKVMEEKKKALILALNRKARVLMSQAEEGVGGVSGDELEKIWRRYRAYFAADTKQKEYVELYIRWSMLHKRYALALQAVHKLRKELGAGTSDSLDELKKVHALEIKLVAHDALNWPLWAAHLQRAEKLSSPADYALF